MLNDNPLLSARGVGMKYGALTALSDVSIDFFPGEVHAVVGENGAGKSTLMRVLSAEEPATSGQVLWNGKPITLSSPKEAKKQGIGVVHQHFQLVNTLTVIENLAMGAYPTRGMGWVKFLDRKKMRESALRHLALFDLESKADMLVGDLTVAERQMVEIIRALQGDSRVVIFDEPTASLGAEEAERLFAVMARMREEGICIILIAHNLDEVLAISDRITILRNGQKIDTVSSSDVCRDELVGLIMGRRLAEGYPSCKTPADEKVLTASGVITTAAGTQENLSLHKGEIVGVPTYIGAQVNDLLDSLVGARRVPRMSLSLKGKDLSNARQEVRIGHGIGVVPGDALHDALIPNMTIEENIMLSMSGQLTSCGVIRRKKAREVALRMIEELGIRPADPTARVDRLSGGNRQKVVVGKWVAAGASVMLLDDPTKAVDVGAKVDIFRLIHKAAQDGAAILFVSSEIEELVGMSHRILVLHQGELRKAFVSRPFDKQTILAEVVGGRAPVRNNLQ